MAFRCAFLQAEIRGGVARKIFYLLSRSGEDIFYRKPISKLRPRISKQIKFFVGITLTSSVMQNVT